MEVSTGQSLHNMFTVTTCRYVGDEYGMMSVMKYNVEDGKLVQLPYQISANSISGDFFTCFLWLNTETYVLVK